MEQEDSDAKLQLTVRSPLLCGIRHGRTVDKELHAFSALPRQLDWWQRTPWKGCSVRPRALFTHAYVRTLRRAGLTFSPPPCVPLQGYFKCFERYLSLLLRLRDTSSLLLLYSLVSLPPGRVAALTDVKRLQLFGSYLLQLLQREELSSALSISEQQADTLMQRACQVAVQLHDYNVDMRELIVLGWRVKRKLEAPGDGQLVARDVEEVVVRDWVEQQRWARRLNIGDVIGGRRADPRTTAAASRLSLKRRRDSSDEEAQPERSGGDSQQPPLPAQPAAADRPSLPVDAVGCMVSRAARADGNADEALVVSPGAAAVALAVPETAALVVTVLDTADVEREDVVMDRAVENVLVEAQGDPVADSFAVAEQRIEGVKNPHHTLAAEPMEAQSASDAEALREDERRTNASAAATHGERTEREEERRVQSDNAIMPTVSDVEAALPASAAVPD